MNLVFRLAIFGPLAWSVQTSGSSITSNFSEVSGLKWNSSWMCKLSIFCCRIKFASVAIFAETHAPSQVAIQRGIVAANFSVCGSVLRWFAWPFLPLSWWMNCEKYFTAGKWPRQKSCNYRHADSTRLFSYILRFCRSAIKKGSRSPASCHQ